MTSQEDFDEQVHQLIEKYGQREFFTKTLETGQVTKQIIQDAEFALFFKTAFRYLISIVIMVIGLTGYLESKPLELLFLVPIGFLIFFVTRVHTRRTNKALAELSKLAMGMHAEKLARE